MHLTLPLWCALVAATPPVPPPVLASDLARFPPADYCEQQYDFARAHVAWLEALAASGLDRWRAAEYDDWLMEARGCRAAWEALDLARQCNADGSETEEYYLIELRDRIGLAAYYAGHMPPPAPFWRFRCVD